MTHLQGSRTMIDNASVNLSFQRHLFPLMSQQFTMKYVRIIENPVMSNNELWLILINQSFVFLELPWMCPNFVKHELREGHHKHFSVTAQGIVTFCQETHRGEDLSGLLNGGDLGPLPLLKELHPGGVVQRCGRMRAEEGGKALAVGQSRRAGAVGQLRQERAAWSTFKLRQSADQIMLQKSCIQEAMTFSTSLVGFPAWRIGDFAFTLGVWNCFSMFDSSRWEAVSCSHSCGLTTNLWCWVSHRDVPKTLLSVDL